MEVELRVEVVDILAAYAIRPAQVIVAEGEELVEGVISVIAGISVTGGEVIAEPELGIHGRTLEMVAGARRDRESGHIHVGKLPELIHAFQFVQELVVVACQPATQRLGIGVSAYASP